MEYLLKLLRLMLLSFRKSSQTIRSKIHSSCQLLPLQALAHHHGDHFWQSLRRQSTIGFNAAFATNGTSLQLR